jgi:hypothetical protein
MEFLRKISKNRNFLRDIIILLLIVTLPFLFFTYNIIPYNSKVWDSDLLSLNSTALRDLDYLIWIIYIKVLTLLILSIWFVTCLKVWRYVLFFPIIVEIYKIFILLVVLKYGYGHENQYLESLLVSTPYSLMLIFFSKKSGFLSKKRKSNIIINHEINKELNKLSKFDVSQYKLVEKKLIKLHSLKGNMDKRVYLTKLITLRDQLTISD